MSDPGSLENTTQEKQPKATVRHIIVKLQKIKDKNSERSQRKKHFTYRTKKRNTSDFSSDTPQEDSRMGAINHQPRILYSVELAFRSKEK